MRCSSFDSRLDEYVEGALSAREAARVGAHLETCASCRELLVELRAIDALLVTPRRLEPAPNFTFAAMAEIRSLPAPHRRRPTTYAVLSAYLAFAWLAIFAYFRFGGLSWTAFRLELERNLAAVSHAGDMLAAGVSSLFGHDPAGVVAAVAALLGVDAVIAVAAYAAYAVVRPRLAAHLARVPERG